MSATDSKTFTTETLADALLALEMSGKSRLGIQEQAEWLMAYNGPSVKLKVNQDLFPTVFGDL